MGKIKLNRLIAAISEDLKAAAENGNTDAEWVLAHMPAIKFTQQADILK